MVNPKQLRARAKECEAKAQTADPEVRRWYRNMAAQWRHLSPGDRMKRREFIGLLGSTAIAWPLAARAQQAERMRRIGMLVPGTRATHGQWFAALVDRLRELGWIEGRTVAFEYRFAEGRTDRAAEIVAEFVRMKVQARTQSRAC